MSAPLVAYYRVSTQRQGASGLGLESQQCAVREHAARTGRALAGEFTEIESGRRNDRPILAEAVARTRATEGATLVVAKLDRLARDAAMILQLLSSGLPVLFLDFPEAEPNTATGRAFVGLLSIFAEFESRRIGERTRAALARRRQRRIEEGLDPDPKYIARQRAARAALAVRQRAAALARRDELGPLLRDIYADLGTLSAVAAELNRRNIPTPRRRKWTFGLVWALLNN